MYNTAASITVKTASYYVVSYRSTTPWSTERRQDAMQRLGLVSLRVVTLCKQLYVLQLPAYSLTFVAVHREHPSVTV